MAPRTIRQVAGVRPHPTVVRLDDLSRSDASWITESYCLTPDVERHLGAIDTALARPGGSGVFLIGPYGSGKSHFLAYLTEKLRAAASAEVHAISLVHYAASARLE